MTAVIPLRLVSEANRPSSEHWGAKRRRAASQQQAVGLVLRQPLRHALRDAPGGLTVTLTRLVGPRGRVMDDDNHVRALKAVRDAVALCLGCDDADPRVTWAYGRQERETSHGVRVTVRKREA